MDFFTGGSVIMDFGLVLNFVQKQKFDLKYVIMIDLFLTIMQLSKVSQDVN